jgi:DNA-binding MarR family transcriptional regulator
LPAFPPQRRKGRKGSAEKLPKDSFFSVSFSAKPQRSLRLCGEVTTSSRQFSLILQNPVNPVEDKPRSFLMIRKFLTVSLLIVALAFSPFASLADEGMWLPDSLNKLPLGQMKKRGFELKPEDVYSTTQASLKDAIVQISAGGTGSFVSGEGLILTNHHVAFSAITRATTTEKDYINNGFVAKSRAEEIPAQGYTVSILQEFKDVTAEMLSAAKPEMSPAERDAALNAKRGEIQKTALAGREKEGIRTQVVEATSGVQYFLYTYLTLRDIRITYAPPKSIGYFGGDPDNFEWPRHCGDFTYLRAYVGADGKPAGFSKDNVPFKPKRFLAVSAAGIKEGDFTFVMGHPGATYRYRESYSLDFRQNIQLPDQISGLKKQIETLTKMGEKNPALKIRLADQIFGLSNSLKSFEGAVVGLKKMNLVERRRAEEEALKKWLEATPAAKSKYGNVLPQIETLYKELSSFSSKQSVFTELFDSGELVNALSYAYLRAADKEKPAGERNPQLSDGALPQITNQLNSGWGEREPAAEAGALAAALESLANLPANQKFAIAENLFGNQTGEARRQAERDFAAKVVINSKFKSFDEVKKLFTASAADIRAIDDPLMKLIVAASDENAPFAKRQTTILNEVVRLRPKYIGAMLEMKKGAYYPDANFTLRFTYGEVKSYKPRDAVFYHWQTSLAGVIAKDTGEEPFNVPAGLKDLAKKKDFGNYFDSQLNDVPVNFLTTTDITGGNSGSPIMNGRGEMIGLVFDGNFEGLGGDYAFDGNLNRTINVDIRYVLFVTEKLGGAAYLFDEMQIKRGKTMAAGK